MPEVKPEEMVHHPPMDQLQEFEYCIDSNPSWGEAITLGFQHYILSLGTAVMIPTMLVPLMGGNDKCKRVDPLSLRTVNGALPCIPVSDRSLLTPVTVPIIRDANIKNDTRLRIFSGTTNPSLSQSQGRESIAAKLVANMITEARANRVLVCDLHSSQAMGYFDIPVDHVYVVSR